MIAICTVRTECLWEKKEYGSIIPYVQLQKPKMFEH